MVPYNAFAMAKLSFDIDAVIEGKARLTDAQALELHHSASLHDLGWIPTVKDWLVNLKVEPWMGRTPFQPSREGMPDEAELPAQG